MCTIPTTRPVKLSVEWAPEDGKREEAGTKEDMI